MLRYRNFTSATAKRVNAWGASGRKATCVAARNTCVLAGLPVCYTWSLMALCRPMAICSRFTYCASYVAANADSVWHVAGSAAHACGHESAKGTVIASIKGQGSDATSVPGTGRLPNAVTCCCFCSANDSSWAASWSPVVARGVRSKSLPGSVPHAPAYMPMLTLSHVRHC